MRVAVLGATGKTGRYLVERLCELGHTVVAVGRRAERLAALDPRAETAIADLDLAETVEAALASAEVVVSLAHARFTETVLASLPAQCARVILTGSTRAFTGLADPAADAVRRSEALFRASGRAGLMLHPSMIYGAPDDRNVNRLLAYMRRWPRRLPVVLPLPDGGAHAVQPVFVDDVVAAFVAALSADLTGPRTIVVAGPEPISYAAMARACAEATGRRLWILPIPARLLTGLAGVAAVLGLRPPFDAAEIARAAEDKRFDITALRDRLGVDPRPFAEGLRLKLARGWAG